MVKFLLCIAVVIFFIFGFYHLPNFISADEHFWLPGSGAERIEDYWKAIADRDWVDTRINDKPGITLAYTSGIAMLFDDADGQIIKRDNTYKQFDPARTQKINFLYRLPILLLSGFFSFFFFWIIKKITGNEWLALWSVTGILLSPILLGMSQIVNPDSLFWIFGFASLLSFYAFLQFQKKKFAFLATLFLGLSLASKYTSIIFIPFFLFMALAYYFFEFEKWRGQRSELRKIMLRSSFAYLAILAGGLLLFAIMMPASFVEPKLFYTGTIGFPGMQPIFWSAMAVNMLIILDAAVFAGRGIYFLFDKLQPIRKFLPKILYFILAGTIIFLIINWLTRNRIIDISDIPFSAKRSDFFSQQPFFKRYFAEFGPLIFALTPLMLFSLLYTWIKGIICEIKHGTLIFILSAFFLVFYAAVIEQGLLVTVRYSIILFPLAILLAGIALDDFFSEQNWKWTRLKNIKKPWIFVGIVFVSVLNLWLITPFYFSYTNELLPKKYIISGAWGYGGYEAAQYLNNLPNAEKLTVWADAYGVCEFFVGKCIHKSKVDTAKYPIDYYFRSLQSTVQLNFPHPAEKTPVWILRIDDRPKSFLKIFKAKPMDPASTGANPLDDALN